MLPEISTGHPNGSEIDGCEGNGIIEKQEVIHSVDEFKYHFKEHLDTQVLTLTLHI